MSYLARIEKGKIKKPSIDLIFGTSGVGKSTWAARFPKPIFLRTEDGANELAVEKLPISRTFEDVIGPVKELLTAVHPFETLVIDSLDHLEHIIIRGVCAENNVEEINALPYGKGYALAMNKWQMLFDQLKLLREKMNVVLICHEQVKQVNDPMLLEPYDRHELKLNAKAAALVKENCDSVLFATYDIVVAKDDKGKAKAYGQGDRILYTQSMPGHEGKNRYGLPYKMKLEENFMSVKDLARLDDAKTLKSIIATHIESLKDQALKIKVKESLAKAGDEVATLQRILNKLQTIKGEQ
jgi:hypothetical protein